MRVPNSSTVISHQEQPPEGELLDQTQHLLLPFQFAYRAKWGVQDFTVALLYLLFKHLEGRKTHTKFLFVDFLSAFNTIQPHLLVNQLTNNLGVELTHPEVCGGLCNSQCPSCQ